MQNSDLTSTPTNCKLFYGLVVKAQGVSEDWKIPANLECLPFRKPNHSALLFVIAKFRARLGVWAQWSREATPVAKWLPNPVVLYYFVESSSPSLIFCSTGATIRCNVNFCVHRKLSAFWKACLAGTTMTNLPLSSRTTS